MLLRKKSQKTTADPRKSIPDPDGRHRNPIGIRPALLICSKRDRPLVVACHTKGQLMHLSWNSYARPMPSIRLSSRIPMSPGYLLHRGEKPCSTSLCSWDLRCCVATSPTSASASAGDAAGDAAGEAAGDAEWSATAQATPMRFLCTARPIAVEFLCRSGPLSAPYESLSPFPVALGRRTPSSARRRRLSHAERGAGRDRSLAGDPSRGRLRRRDGTAIVRHRLATQLATQSTGLARLPERNQQCSTSS
jgi:hypothetical protein